MKKLIPNDFTKMMPSKGSIGGSVAKSMMNTEAASKITQSTTTNVIVPSEAFNGQLESGGVIGEPVNPSNNTNGGMPSPIKPKSNGIDPVVVITLVVVAGLITWGAVAIMQEREMYNSNNTNTK